jgi:DNA gyrase subunit A
VLTAADLIPDLPVWVAVSGSGLVARTPDDGSPVQVPSRPQDAPLALLAASTRDTLYLFAADGRAVAFPVHQLPEGVAWEGAGAHYADLTPLGRRDTVVAAVAIPPGRGEASFGPGIQEHVANGTPRPYLFMATQRGVVKRVALADLPGVSSESFTVIGVDEGDALIGAALTSGEDEVLLVTYAGQAIRFKEGEVRPMGLAAGGVMGVKLSGPGDRVVALAVARPRSDLLVATEDGKAKRTPLTEYPTQGRHGQGVVTARLADEVGVAGAGVVQSDSTVVLVTEKGAAKTIRARSAPRTSRPTQGQKVIALRKGDRVSAVLCPAACART